MSRRQRLSEGPPRPPVATVRDIMTADAVTVSPETSVPRIAQLMDSRAISGLPVIDGSRRVVGVVTDADLVSRNTRLEAPEIPEIGD